MDNRTKKQKLQAMARQSVSPNEAKVAETKLNEMEAKEREAFKNPAFSVNAPFISMADALKAADEEIKKFEQELRKAQPSGYYWSGEIHEKDDFGIYMYDFMRGEWIKHG